MSVHLTSAAWKVTGLSVVQKIALVKLADTAGDDGRCWPSIATVARECGCTERAIYSALDCLESKGHLSRSKRAGTSSIYTVHPCTSFTPERSSPLNDVHLTPESGSPHPCTTFTSPLNVVQPNRKEPSKNRKEPSIKEKLPELPFSSAEFAEAWNDFLNYRKSMKKPVTAMAAKRQFADFVKWGEQAAIQSIDDAIKNAWRGTFQPKSERTGYGQPKPPKSLSAYEPTANAQPDENGEIPF